MPMITIKYDNSKISGEVIQKMSESIQQIVSKATNIRDVFVYAESPEITVATAPAEVFIEMSANKIIDEDKLIKDIKEKIMEWKAQEHFNEPINLTLIPMVWKIEIGI